MNLFLLVCIVSQIIGNFWRLQFYNLCKYVLESPWELPLSQTKYFFLVVHRCGNSLATISFSVKSFPAHTQHVKFLHQGNFKRRACLLFPSKRANKFVKERLCLVQKTCKCQETCTSVVFMVCPPVLSVKVSLFFLLQTSIHIPQTQHLQLFEGKLRIEGNK